MCPSIFFLNILLLNYVASLHLRFILEKYTLLKSLALVILHHNHSLLTRYDFLPFMYCLVVPKNLGFPKNKKKQKKIKTKQKKQKNNFPEVFALGASAERVLKYCFFFFVFFFLIFFIFLFFFGFLETPGFLEPPNSQTSGKLYFLVFLNTQNIWSYLKCLYLLQKLQKNICKSLSLSGAKFPEKNIYKSMENRTLRDTRSANIYIYIYCVDFTPDVSICH